jgi:hypothetical protein
MENGNLEVHPAAKVDAVRSDEVPVKRAAEVVACMARWAYGEYGVSHTSRAHWPKAWSDSA